MSRPVTRRLAALSVPCLLASSVFAGVPGVATRPFPMNVVADHGKFGVELAPDAAALADLAKLTRVTLTGVPLPLGASAELDLARVTIADAGGRVDVDGVPQAPSAAPQVTLWAGHVTNDPDSAVYLGFSASGSRGFIRTAGVLFQVLAAPGPNGDWAATTSTIINSDQVVPPASATIPDWCHALPNPNHPITLPIARPASTSIASTTVVPIYSARIGIETDTQYYNLFNDLAAAQSYLAQLLGAVSYRYREQVGVILTYPYIGLHTGPDQWVSQENGSGAGGLLGEFQAAWSGGHAPVAANDYCFVSGAGLGGGVAWLPGLCDPTYGFAVCGNIGGNTPFPVSVGALNWDFIVVAHELGHNFGAPHTHDYCPPADQCAPAGYFGQCQTQQVCTTQGSIMSYCHLCGAGMLNETTFFHPQSVADMRALTTAGCLGLFEGFASNVNLGFSMGGANGNPSLTASYDTFFNLFKLDLASAPSNKTGVIFFAPNMLFAPLYGGILVPNTTVTIPIATNAAGGAQVAAFVSASTHIPGGATFFAQAWVSDPGPPNGPFAASNAVQFEIILP